MRIIKKLILPFMIGCIIFCVLSLLRYGNDHWLGDCLSITGFLMMGYAGLVFVAHEGTFNIVTYGFMKFFDMFRKNPHVTVRYEEYVLIQKDKTKSPVWPILVIGILFLVVGTIILYV